MFPANAIFVCDNSPSLNPWDDTEKVCDKVSYENADTSPGEGKINYVYIPEGNKSFALYWVTEHWIPALVCCCAFVVGRVRRGNKLERGRAKSPLLLCVVCVGLSLSVSEGEREVSSDY